MKTQTLLLFILLFTIGVKAQPWIGPVPGNIYYNQGNVGIGTTTPQYKLDVSVLSATNENNIIANFTRNITSTGGSGILRLNYHSTCDLEINSGYSAVGHRYGEYFDFNIVNNFTGGNWGAINFVTNALPRMAIKANGNIGIGTNSPKQSLEIANMNNFQLRLGGAPAWGDAYTYDIGRNTVTGVLNFYGNRSGYTGYIFGGVDGTLMTMLNNGNVGIGTTNPGAKLEINGSLRIQGNSADPNYYTDFFNGYPGGLTMITKEYAQPDTKLTLFRGNVGIGTASPTYKLDVIGTIRAKEIKVDLNGADFVFEKEYKLMPLDELEAFVKEQKHLPEVAPAKEMQENGTDLGNLNSKLLQKIEELTLYLIDQNKQISGQNKQINLLKEENKAIRKLIAK